MPMQEKATRGLDSAQLNIIARVAHEAIRTFQAAAGQAEAPPWDDAPDWMRKASYDGVKFRLKHPEATPERQHQDWVNEKIATGWKFGPVKDSKAKTHPMLIPYDQLEEIEKRKDMLFSAIVTALTKRD